MKKNRSPFFYNTILSSRKDTYATWLSKKIRTKKTFFFYYSQAVYARTHINVIELNNIIAQNILHIIQYS